MCKRNIWRLFFYSFILFSQVAAEPWGKDADLAIKNAVNGAINCPVPSHLSPHLLSELAKLLINFHQNVISPADGPRSHYLPSSSQYTLQAIQNKGFLRGFAIGCDRLMRENSDPWIYRTARNENGKLMKWDPVK